MGFATVTGSGAHGLLRFESIREPVLLGANGISPEKEEGDMRTPAGRFLLRRVLFRADRVAPPATSLPREPIAPEDGWCDDPAHPDYNRFVALPHPARHERLWRDDRQYDVVGVLGHNDDPPVPGRGSAVFLHVSAADGRPTAGCVAMEPEALLRLLAAGLTGLDIRP
jgi:L,D-peptidoglycan transpeptidase YkuD (ErfK/YbiS/YcfS/YnhG family)